MGDNVDYVIHRDDPYIVDRRDVNEAAKRVGKYQFIRVFYVQKRESRRWILLGGCTVIQATKWALSGERPVMDISGESGILFGVERTDEDCSEVGLLYRRVLELEASSQEGCRLKG